MPDEQPTKSTNTRPNLTTTGPVRVPVEYASDQHGLRTERLTIRPLLEADRDDFVAALTESREHLDSFLPLHEPGWTDQDVFDRQLAWSIEGIARGTAVRRAIFDDLGVFLGCCNLIKIDRSLELRAELSIWIRRHRIRQGIGFEAMTAVIDDAFEDLPRGLGLHTISGHIQPENIPSHQLATRLGFLQTGDPPQQMSVGGKWKIHQKHTLTPDRWAISRQAPQADRAAEPKARPSARTA